MTHLRKIALSLGYALLSTSITLAAEPDSAEQLLRAIQIQDTQKVNELIASGADVNASTSDRPLIVWAAQNDNIEIIRALISAKADVNKTDLSFKESALHRAIDNQHEEVVSELLKAKADPNAKNARGESCLALAVKGDKPGIVASLIAAGADVTYVSSDDDSLALIAAQANNSASPEVIRLLGKSKSDLNKANAVYTPLTYAIDVANKDLVKALLESGADPNVQAPSGRTALYTAIKDVELVQLLLNAKANPNASTNGVSPILIAALENGTDDSVKAIIEAGADVNVADDHGNTALQVASNYSRDGIVALLKAKGAVK